jgi:hypothetical protein
MVWRQETGKTIRQASTLPPEFKPCGMHTIACAIDVAAWNSFMALHNIEAPPGKMLPYALGKASITPQTSNVKRRNALNGAFPFAPPLTGNQCGFDAFGA